jgi:hypothetical protein
MTVRPDYAELMPSAWTPEEAEHHLRGTFNMACKAWPDVMEPYVIQLDGADGQVAHMRRALRETITKRIVPQPQAEAAE